MFNFLVSLLTSVVVLCFVCFPSHTNTFWMYEIASILLTTAPNTSIDSNKTHISPRCRLSFVYHDVSVLFFFSRLSISYSALREYTYYYFFLLTSLANPASTYGCVCFHLHSSIHSISYRFAYNWLFFFFFGLTKHQLMCVLFTSTYISNTANTSFRNSRVYICLCEYVKCKRVEHELQYSRKRRSLSL